MTVDVPDMLCCAVLRSCLVWVGLLFYGLLFYALCSSLPIQYRRC